MQVFFREAQGKRPYMEDRYQHCTLVKDVEFIAIYDGHGGDEVADICVANFPDILRQGMSFSSDMGIVIRNSFYIVDEIVRKYNMKSVGSTVVFVIIEKDRVWFANCGDSMTMVSYRSGNSQMMSEEHKVENEKERIISEGGNITYDDGCARIDRMLNVSRAIGDFHLKKHVNCNPYIRTIARDFKDIDYILLGSDGLWDVFSNKELAIIYKEDTNANVFLDKIVSYSTIFGSDNVTAACIQMPKSI